MIRKFLFLVAIAVASVMTATAQDLYAPIPSDPAIRTGVLENGMSYYIRHNAKPEKQAEFFIYHDVGAIQEADDQQGLAHFLEHMAFNGTKNLPGKQIINWLETVGVKFGANLNAGTGIEMTVYMLQSVPVTRESIIDSALMVLHDWSYFITLDGKEIDNERGVIIEELRTRNTASWRASEKSKPYLYGDTKYTYRNLIGYEDFLRTFEHQNLRDFYHQWYRTDQQVIVVVGDIDVDAVEAKIIKMMADIPAVENPQPKEVIMIPDNVEPIVGVVTDPELTGTSVKFYIKREALPKEANNLTLVYLMGMIDNVATTIVNERLRDITQKPGAPFTGAYFTTNGYSGAQTMDVVYGNITARDGESLKAFEAFYAEVEKVLRYGFTEAELERAKTQILRDAQRQYDYRDDRRSEEFVWTMIGNFAQNTPMPSAETEWELDQTILNSINLETLNKFTQGRLTRENQVVIVTAPEKEGVYVPSNEEMLAVIAKVQNSEIEAPASEAVTEPLIPANMKFKGSKVKKSGTDKFGATTWELKNGVKVVVQPTDYKNDEVVMRISSGGGLSVLADDEVISANMLPSYISQAGVSKFSASDLRKQLTGKAVRVSPYIGQYSNGFTGSASPKDIETLMQLVYLNFTSPRFNEDDYNVLMDRTAAQYANMASNPMFVLNDSLMNILFDHNPRRQMLTYEKLDQVDFGKMQTIFHKLYSNPDDFTFTFVGNINPDELKPLVEKYLGSLPKSKKSFTWKDDGVRYVQGVVESRFTTPMQMPKTTVLLIFNGEVPYSLENELAFETLAQALDMRYTESIREEKGGTYGVGVQAGLSYMPIDSYNFLITFDTDPGMAEELLEIVYKEIDEIAANGVNAEALSKIKEYYTKQHADDLRQNSYWSGLISDYHVSGKDMVSGYMDIINGFTPDYFKSIASKMRKDNNIMTILMTNE